MFHTHDRCPDALTAQQKNRTAKEMSDFLAAIGLLLVLEGIAYSLFPGPLKRMMAQVMQTPPEALRIAGLLAVTAGVGLVWIVRG